MSRHGRIQATLAAALAAPGIGLAFASRAPEAGSAAAPKRMAQGISTVMDKDGGFEELSWRNVNVSVDVTPAEMEGGKKPFIRRGALVPKQLLFNVSGKSAKGRLLALMGPSGAGKTTLLNVLAGRTRGSRFEGELQIDGQPLDGESAKQAFAARCAFVQQQDVFLAASTVREHLEFQANLLGAGKALVGVIMRLLRIENTADSLIGAEGSFVGKGISGGEMKRLSIASELLRNPYFLLADEPTSGLDSALAEDVVAIMRTWRR